MKLTLLRLNDMLDLSLIEIFTLMLPYFEFLFLLYSRLFKDTKKHLFLYQCLFGKFDLIELWHKQEHSCDSLTLNSLK